MKISNGSFAFSSSLAAKAIAGLALVAGLAACGDDGDDSAVPQPNDTVTNNGGGTTTNNGGGTTTNNGGGGTTTNNGGGTTMNNGGGGTTTNNGGGGTTTNNDDDTTTNNNTPQPGELTGKWAQLVVTSSLADVPFEGTVTTTTSSMLLIDVTHTGDQLQLRTSTCAVNMNSTSNSVETIIPPAFVTGLPETTRSGSTTLDASGNLQVSLPYFTEVFGARLTDIENEALPTSSSDPRVYDQDNDGNPGMTVSISGIISGDIYIVQRGRNSLTSSVSADKSRWDGLVQWDNEQVTLGASNSILTSVSPEATVDPNANNSFFRTTRVNAAMDCATVVSTAEQLFAR